MQPRPIVEMSGPDVPSLRISMIVLLEATAKPFAPSKDKG
jgi:hypothetical protein